MTGIFLLLIIVEMFENFLYYTHLKKWVEIGNSSTFRPDMLLPMGLPDNVNFIALGPSLERWVHPIVMNEAGAMPQAQQCT